METQSRFRKGFYMSKLLTIFIFLLSTVSFVSQANTLITPENLDRLQASFSALQALEQGSDEDNSEQSDFKLDNHCDWKKHYESVYSNVKSQDYRQFESLIKKYGFNSGAEYFELSMKAMYPTLTMLDEYLKQNNVTPDPKSEIGKHFLNMQEMGRVVGSCLSRADKIALKKYENKINEIHTLMMEYDGYKYDDQDEYYDQDDYSLEY